MPERPTKAPDFELLTEDPLNGQPPLGRLVEAEITPREHFYVRNHAPVPAIDADAFRLEFGGLVERPLALSLTELAAEFPVVEVTATLQCAGNRRTELAAVRPIPGEEPWGASAIGNAVWRGVQLAAVLAAAGIAPDAAHVELLGLDRIEKEGETFPFGGSIPLAKAHDPSVLLAFAMNGEPLPPEHGYPLRAIVPGYIGARSVKWLGTIALRREPSENFYQQRAYKLYPPGVSKETAARAHGVMLGELSLSSVICRPTAGEELPAGPVAVRGWALAGGGRTIERVDVSADGGHTWVSASPGAGLGATAPGVWCLWEADVELPTGPAELVCRAVDSAANSQPEALAPLWNFKGYMNNAWHRVPVRCR